MRRGIAILALAVILAWLVYVLGIAPDPEDATDSVDSRHPVADIDEIHDDLASRKRTAVPATVPTTWAERYTTSSFGCSLGEFEPFAGETYDEDEFRHRVAAIASHLAVSGDVEHVLASVVLSRSGGVFSAPERIDRALALDPANELVLWTADMLCADGADAGYCGDAGFRQDRDAILARNGAHWLRQAQRHHEHGDDGAAHDALERASTEPRFDTYFIDYAMLLERALAASSDMDYALRMTIAIGYAATMPTEPTGILQTCRDRSESDSRWLPLCIRVSERLVSDGNTLLLQMLGREHLATLYDYAGQTEARDAIVAERDAWRQRLGTPNPDREIAMLSDPGFYARYIDVFASGGETAALDFANAEIERRKQDPDYNPCENVPAATPPSTGSGRE